MNKWILVILIILTIIGGICCCIVIGATIAAPSLGDSISELLTPAPSPTPAPVTYDYTNIVVLENKGNEIIDKLEIYKYPPQEINGVQNIISLEITPGNYQQVQNTVGETIIKYEFLNINQGEKITISEKGVVTVFPIINDLGQCQGEMITGWTDQEEYIESDHPKIIELADNLSAGKNTVCEKVRAYYDYIGSSMTYKLDFEDRGALYALENKTGDCTEYSNLLIALCRASGIPARGVMGFGYGTDDDEIYSHHWAEVYFPGSGWLPVDPTFGQNNPEQYFAGLAPTHIMFNDFDELDKSYYEQSSLYYLIWTSSGESNSEMTQIESMTIVK